MINLNGYPPIKNGYDIFLYHLYSMLYANKILIVVLGHIIHTIHVLELLEETIF